MHKWNIYFEDREYADQQGDPCLATVWAPNKQEAIQKYFSQFGHWSGAAVMAVPVIDRPAAPAGEPGQAA